MGGSRDSELYGSLHVARPDGRDDDSCRTLFDISSCKFCFDQQQRLMQYRTDRTGACDYTVTVTKELTTNPKTQNVAPADFYLDFRLNARVSMPGRHA